MESLKTIVNFCIIVMSLLLVEMVVSEVSGLLVLEKLVITSICHFYLLK